MSESVRVLIVDDEPLARRRLKRLLAEERGVEVVGESASGEEALAAIEAEDPHVVLLDVQMPGLTGLDVIRALPETRRSPAVILVTAFDRYAIEAFDAEALDYLLKPVEAERLSKALARARRRLAEQAVGSLDRKLERLIERFEPGADKYRGRFSVRRGKRIYFVTADEIDWIEADGNYVCLRAGGKRHLVRASMQELERCLDPRRFLRIHRSAIVNLDRVVSLEPWYHGEFVLTLSTGDQVRSSRSYSEQVRALLEEG